MFSYLLRLFEWICSYCGWIKAECVWKLYNATFTLYMDIRWLMHKQCYHIWGGLESTCSPQNLNRCLLDALQSHVAHSTMCFGKKKKRCSCQWIMKSSVNPKKWHLIPRIKISRWTYGMGRDVIFFMKYLVSS